MKAKKVLALMLAAIMLVCTSVAATIAYLTDKDTAVNTFTVGQVHIKLDEADVNTDGTLISGADRVTENQYHLLPGRRYEKDPEIHVTAGSEDCFLFVKIVNEITELENVADTVSSQMEANGWECVTGDIWVYTANTNTPAKVSAGEDIPVFEYFKIKDNATNDELARYAPVTTGEGNEQVTTFKTITVTAYAIQAAGFENSTASDIWTTAAFI